jgi:hypothetical protein
VAGPDAIAAGLAGLFSTAARVAKVGEKRLTGLRLDPEAEGSALCNKVTRVTLAGFKPD